MAKRYISQETFDAVVRENEEDFGLERSAAILDAISQFKSQGVDITGVDTTGGIGLEQLELSWACVEDSASSQEEKIEAFHTLIRVCSDDFEYSLRNQNLFRIKGWYYKLLQLLDHNLHPSLLYEIMALMLALCKTNVDNRDFFEPSGSGKLTSIIRTYLTQSNNGEHIKLLVVSFKLVSMVAKTENNKFMLFRDGLKDIIPQTISRDCLESDEIFELVRVACHAMKVLCTQDDLRKEASCAMDNGKYFMNAGCVPHLINLSNLFRTRPLVASAALSACRQLVLTEEAVKVVAQHVCSFPQYKLLNE